MTRATFLFLLAIFIAGCALPADEKLPLDFVPGRDLDAVSLARQGMSDFGRGNFVDAELKFRQALYLIPGAANIRQNLALTLIRLENYSEGIAIYHDLLKDQPDSLALTSDLAESYYLAGNLDKASRYYQQVLEARQKNFQNVEASRAARSLSVLNFRRGREEDALCYSQTAYALDNGPDELFRHLRLLTALHLYGNARELLQAQLTLSGGKKEDPRFWAQSALVEFALGHNAEALHGAVLAQDYGADSAGYGSTINLIKLAAVENATAQERGEEPLTEAWKAEVHTTSALLYLPVRFIEKLDTL